MNNLSGATTAVFTISLSAALETPVTVAWQTKDGTAKAGTDYEAASGSVTFEPGETAKQIQVVVYGRAEGDTETRTFGIELYPPENAILDQTLTEIDILVTDEDGTTVTSLVVATGPRGLKGDPGLSAYQLAVLQGYTGTLEQWLQEQTAAGDAAERAETAADTVDQKIASATSQVLAQTGADATRAESAADRAEAVVDNDNTYPTIEAGLAATTSGGYFWVPQGPGSVKSFDYYRNNAGVAKLVTTGAGGAAVSAVKADVDTQSNYLDVVANSVYSNLKTEIAAVGTVELEKAAMMRVKEVRNTAANGAATVATLKLVQGTSEYNELLLPGEYIDGSGKNTAYVSVKVADQTSHSVNIGATATRYTSQMTNPPFITNQTTSYNIFDKTGFFAATTQTLAATAVARSVSTHSVGFQLVLPNSDITGAGFTLDAAGVHAYVTANYAQYEFTARTNTVAHKPQKTSRVYDAGNVVVSSTGTLSLDLKFYEPQENKNIAITGTGGRKYSSMVKNNLNVAIENAIAEIRATFGPGEAPNEDCLVLTDLQGNVVPCQWQPEPAVNYDYDQSLGYHADGSLRCGTVTFDADFVAKSENGYRLWVYQDEKKSRSKPELVQSGADLKLTLGAYTYNFESVNGFQLSSFTFAGVTSQLKYGAYFAIKLFNQPDYDRAMLTGFKSINVTAWGDVFVEVTTVLEMLNVRATIKTRLTAGGKVFIDTTMLTLADIPADTCFGLTGRLEMYSPGADRNATLMTNFWQAQSVNRSAHLLYCHGHVHRDGNLYEAQLPVWTFTTAVDANTNRLYGGWMYRTTTLPNVAIAKNNAFAHGYYADLAQVQTTTAASNDVAHNTPTGVAGKGIIELEARKTLMQNTLSYVYARADFWDAFMIANNTSKDMNIWAAHLALLKYGVSKKYTFNEIHANFIAYLQSKYGGPANLGNAYRSDSLVLQFASRATVPNILWQYKEAVAQSDTAKQDILKTAIKSLADAMVSTFSEKGFIPLNYSSSASNSNSNATGLRILSVGIHLGLDTDGSYLTTLTAVENLLKTTYAQTQNIMTESPSGVLAGNQYLHYSMYAFHDYFRACSLLGRPLALDMTTYMLTALASYGALREQQFCISNSRKGSSLTYAYYISVLNKIGGISGQAGCLLLLDHLHEQMDPDNSIPRPMDDWPPNLNTGAASPVPFELQALSEMLLEDYYK